MTYNSAIRTNLAESPRSMSVVIPCFNESAHVEDTINRLTTVLECLHLEYYEIIAIEDGSSDDTLSKLLSSREANQHVRVLCMDHNLGKGHAVRTGILEATGDVIAFIDADLEIHESAVSDAWTIMSTRPISVLIASRTLEGSITNSEISALRRVMSGGFNMLCRVLVGVGQLRDTQCGFKVFRREAAQRIFALQTIDRFAFDVEILYLARRMGYRIHEMPVTWRNRSGSTVDPIKDSIQMLKDVVRIKATHRRVPHS